MEVPESQVRPQHLGDRYGPMLVDKADKLQQQAVAMSGVSKAESHEPAGGYDSTPLPQVPPGYTLKFTFHRGVNLPCADFGTFSSDPYIHAALTVDVPLRHKQDPFPSYRTPTVRKNRDPVWEKEWIVANIPASGFRLKCRVYDEDAADHDDKLGNAYIQVNSINEQWAGIHEQPFRLKKHTGSKRVYLFGNIAALASRRLDTDSHLVISVECLGKSPGANGAQVYTVGPNYWFKHFSPLIGRLIGTKDAVQSQDGKKTVNRYNFQAIQMQLKGPVPSGMYHRYVEFKPFVAGMFTSHTLRGRILNRALHHQHERIYNFDRATLDGEFESPCVEMTQKLLEFTHYAQGGRVFTYVLTLDGQFRFTETGKEFGIDLLSKHTMHSNVSYYIAYSGEFFIRRRKHRHRGLSLVSNRSSTDYVVDHDGEEMELSKDPSRYELFIDNDSGTYRPNAEKLPLLKEFFSSNFPELHITTLDCQGDAERMQELKNEQREQKRNAGVQMAFLQQRSRSSSSLSISSSDEEELNERSGLKQKKRGDFAKRVHEMRDVKGQVLRWAAEEEQNGDGKQGTTSRPPEGPCRSAHSGAGEQR
ncbi:C2 domain protein [Aspergillus undulatus]|uniref:C2 domain protein n=1 Tax=Aspergillus undulatus TaxID=1810928 RepID=UPI003CCD9CAA